MPSHAPTRWGKLQKANLYVALTDPGSVELGSRSWDQAVQIVQSLVAVYIYRPAHSIDTLSANRHRPCVPSQATSLHVIHNTSHHRTCHVTRTHHALLPPNFSCHSNCVGTGGMNLAYDVEKFDRTASGETPSHYRSQIAVGRAPAIKHGDMILVESGAITEYDSLPLRIMKIQPPY